MDDPTTVLEGGVPASVTTEAPEVTALVERAKLGEPEAFNGLMLLYERRIISLGIQMGLSREDALDACQETFLKVFRYIGRFRSGETFFKWLYRIAVNSVYDQLRRSRTPGVMSMDDVPTAEAARLHDGAQSAHEVAVSNDLTGRLMRNLGALSKQERIVFVLRDLQQVSTIQIGRILGLSQITVRRHCMLARQKLRDRVFPKHS